MNENYGIVDLDSGELFGEYRVKNKRKSNNQYVLLYFRRLLELNIEITPAIALILGEIDNRNVISMSHHTKDYIAKQLNTNVKVINSIVCRLKNRHVLIKIGPSAYFADPNLVSKTNKDHIEQLRMKFNQMKANILEMENKNSDKPTKVFNINNV